MVDKGNSQEKSPLRKRREELGKTRVQVGRDVGVSERNIYDWETGKFLPRLDRAVLLARSLRLPLKQLCMDMGIDVAGIPDDMEEQNKSAEA